VTEEQEKEWLEEVGRLKLLDRDAQRQAVAMIRSLAIGTKGRVTVERRAKFIEKHLGLSEPLPKTL
jgi:hypothetical protein